MSEIIWVMDSDLCEMCNGLLDWMGQCPHCGWDSYPEPTYYEDEEDPFDEPTIGTPEEAHIVALSLSDDDMEQLLDSDDFL